METVQFKKNSGAGAQSFDAVKVEPELITEDERWTDLSGTRQRDVFFTWTRWEITFGLLTTTQMDYLGELQAEEAPQMIYATVTYNIEVESLRAKYKGGTITVVNRDPE